MQLVSRAVVVRWRVDKEHNWLQAVGQYLLQI
jgi:hypothetical protein